MKRKLREGHLGLWGISGSLLKKGWLFHPLLDVEVAAAFINYFPRELENYILESCVTPSYLQTQLLGLLRVLGL